MRNFVYLITFFTLTPLTLLGSLLTLKAVSLQSSPLEEQTGYTDTLFYGLPVYAAIPEDSIGEVLGATTSADARAEIIRQYLEKYNSPLEPYKDKLVEAADKYNLDFRLLVAIAQQESNLCKKVPVDSFNCWGWGVHSQGTLGFSSFEEAIEKVAQGLKEDYFDKGYTTPEQIMSKYTPLSPGTWAAGVNQFLTEME